MTPLTTLYVDMNSFFASVEQHLDPRLRGRPVAITAVDSNSGACVAASYEAKAFGVKTGTPVWEAKRLCPDIIFRPSRHRLYVRFNLRVAEILDRMAELERIRSVDEYQLRLSGQAQTVEGATDLVRRLKAAVRQEIGPCLRFSAGMGPNHLLAKIAGKLEKPDGCQWLLPENMPGRIAHMALDDLPGISRGIKARLWRACIWDTEALYRLDPRHARMIWRSVEGERFVRALQGEAIPLIETERHGYGNSKVLAPENRTVPRAYYVTRWLIEKATARIRRDGRVAGQFSLTVFPVDERVWGRSIKCETSQDTTYFHSLNRDLWRAYFRRNGRRPILSVSIHLGNVSLLSDRPGDLFRPLAPATRTKGEDVSAVLDMINRRFGADTIRFGQNRPHYGFFEKG